MNDDGTIPRTSEWLANWLSTGLNNFRQNVVGELGVDAIPDLTSRGSVFQCSTDGSVLLTAELCNRGTQPVSSGAPLTFYSDMTSLCTARSQSSVVPGQCVSV